MSLFSLGSRVFAVTGATGVLAGAVARYLVEQGALVAFVGRNESRLNAATEPLGESAAGFVCDVTDPKRLDGVVEDIVAHFGRIDGLVNGAGGNMPGATVPPDGSVFDLDLTDYDSVLKLNLHGTLLPSLAFGKRFSEQERGAVVNFSSASSAQAITRVLGYSNAKAAVDNLTRWMATDFARGFGDRIRVNAVCPGFFVGEQNRRLLLKEDGSLTPRGEQIIGNTPMSRFGEAEEVCGAVHFLLSDASRFVTGQVLHVDGGFSIYSGV